MANYALLLGTKADKTTLIEKGQPVEIRRKFKDITAADGFDTIEVGQAPWADSPSEVRQASSRQKGSKKISEKLISFYS